MRNWKNWLFPILTALTVTALALLPLRLSTLEDSRLTGTVHAEDLSEDSNFPFKPPGPAGAALAPGPVAGNAGKHHHHEP